MARTAITMSKFVVTGLTDPSGTTITSGIVTNGANIAVPNSGDVGAVPPFNDAYRGIVLRVVNATTNSTASVIVRAGVNPPAMRKDLGDLTVTITSSGTEWIGPFEMGRHAQSDDSINVDFGTGFSGTLTAFIMPRNV